MTKKNDMRTTVGLACVVVLLLVSSLVGSSSYGRGEVRKTVSSFTGTHLDESDTMVRDRNISQIFAAGAPFLFAVAICGLVTGILGAVVLPEGDAEPQDGDGSDDQQRKRDFAAALATALPTVAVRLSSTTTEQQPLILIDEFASTTPWATA